MPRIEAATVAEHRALRERQVGEAAADLLTSAGAAAVTPAAVAARTGLARSSVYQYADSAAALVGVAMEELFERTDRAIASALAVTGDDPGRRLDAIVRTVLEGASTGHGPHQAVDVAQLPADHQVRLRELHALVLAALAEVISELWLAGAGPPGGDRSIEDSVTDARTMATLVWGVINGAVPLLEQGQPVGWVVGLVSDFVHGGLTVR